MISSATPLIPTVTGLPQPQRRADRRTNRATDPLHVLAPDVITRAVEKPRSYAPQLLAGGVVVSTAGAAALVGYIAREHLQAKAKARAARKAAPHPTVAR